MARKPPRPFRYDESRPLRTQPRWYVEAAVFTVAVTLGIGIIRGFQGRGTTGDLLLEMLSGFLAVLAVTGFGHLLLVRRAGRGSGGG